MVLDYLDETRDSPDQDLLEQLNWSKEGSFSIRRPLAKSSQDEKQFSWR